MLGIPIPGNVLGFGLLAVAPFAGIIDVENVAGACNLLDHLTLLFAPVIVGIVLYKILSHSMAADIRYPRQHGHYSGLWALVDSYLGGAAVMKSSPLTPVWVTLTVGCFYLAALLYSKFRSPWQIPCW